MINITWEELINTKEGSYNNMTLKDVIPLIPEDFQNNTILISIMAGISHYSVIFNYKDLCTEDDDIIIKEFKSIAINSKLSNIYIDYKYLDEKCDIIVIDLDSDINIMQQMYFCVVEAVEQCDDSLTFSYDVENKTSGFRYYDEFEIEIDLDKFSELYKNDKALFHYELHKCLLKELGEHSEKRPTNIGDICGGYGYVFSLV